MYNGQTQGYEKIARRKWAGWRAWIWIQRILQRIKSAAAAAPIRHFSATATPRRSATTTTAIIGLE